MGDLCVGAGDHGCLRAVFRSPAAGELCVQTGGAGITGVFCGAANDIHCTVGLERNTLPTCGMAELASDPIREFPVLWTGGGAAWKAKGSTCGWTSHWAKSLSGTGSMSSGAGKRPAVNRVFCRAGIEKGAACVGEHQFLLTDTSLRGIRFLCFRVSGSSYFMEVLFIALQDIV